MPPLDGLDSAWVLAADERDPRLVVVGDGSGILVTLDAGCTWERSVDYAEHLAPLVGRPLDAVVAGTARDRSLHVLVAPWQAFVPGLPPRLFSSYDDGATWTVVDLPAPAGSAGFASFSLTSSAGSPGRVYVLADHGAAGVLYAGSGTGEWQWRSLALPSAPESCVPDSACLSRPLRELQADPAEKGELWALSSRGSADSEGTLAFSSDEGAAWRSQALPSLTGGPALLEVSARGAVVLLSDFWEYAVSRDGGRSWAVGDYPKLTSSTSTSAGVFELADFDEGRAIAALPGAGPESGWAGNVLVFDGRRWTEATPRGFEGYDRTDARGDRLAFTALAGSDDTLLALSSTGHLMSFRRR